MKAMRFHAYGEPTVLRYEDIDQPVPSAGEVLIRVAATSFNGVDGNIRAGFMQGPIPVTLPHTPGIDVSGTIAALGDDVTGLAVGDRVVGFLPMTGAGAAAEYVVAPAGILAPAPTAIDLTDAAALPTVGLTAYQALFDHAKLTSGQRVLINGAGGAVGDYAVQLAKGAGAYVIATTSTRTSDRAKAAGADEVINHTTVKPVEAALNADPVDPELDTEPVNPALNAKPADPALNVEPVNPEPNPKPVDPELNVEPVDVVLNLAPIDPAQLAALLDLIRPGGVLVNTTVWMPAPSDERRNVRGIDLFVRSDATQLTHLAGLVDSGELRVEVAQRVPLTELPSVHAQATAHTLPGKTVIIP
ncbi:NADP-dependent oxidoreductase [Actinoplanes sichuanensis]|uniref:NADP-dependent oxidoreductase n=1 Tax=Actinoplanes sichuanensis TaxID=512349 RepID=A0ABW4A164_9ACTN|nr:NADP-dependent oxidoreductase [Actinoplanes sichuanensis]